MPDEVKLLPCPTFPELQNWFFQKLDPRQRDGFFLLFGMDFGNTASFGLRHKALCKIHRAWNTRAIEATRPTEQGLGALTDDQVKRMVDRFLMWKMPADFSPDGGVRLKQVFGQNWPIGTNLLDARQAEAMVRFMLEDVGP